MGWDGKKTDEQTVRGYVCAGCEKARSSADDGTLIAFTFRGRKLLIHKHCEQLCIKRRGRDTVVA